jgi:hypothetical protein
VTNSRASRMFFCEILALSKICMIWSNCRRREAYAQLPEKKQCHAIELLSRRFCAADRTLLVDRLQPNTPTSLRCSWCDLEENSNVKRLPNIGSKRETQAIFSKLIRTASFISSKRPRVVAMLALRRLVLHADDGDFVDLESSVPGQWCIQSLQSSLRELRIAAGSVSLPPRWHLLTRRTGGRSRCSSTSRDRAA